MTALRVLLVDHHDSFAFLLAEQFAARGALLCVIRCPAHAATIAAAAGRHRAQLVVLSPGPGHPAAAGATVAWLAARPELPVFGVCLGHQAIALAAGAQVVAAERPVHGMASAVELQDDALFVGLPRTLPVARYHSLVATMLPDCLQVLARCRAADGGQVMALRHRQLPQLGVQFHPESVLTPHGGVLVANVLAWATAVTARAAAPAMTAGGEPS